MIFSSYTNIFSKITIIQKAIILICLQVYKEKKIATIFVSYNRDYLRLMPVYRIRLANIVLILTKSRSNMVVGSAVSHPAPYTCCCLEDWHSTGNLPLGIRDLDLSAA